MIAPPRAVRAFATCSEHRLLVRGVALHSIDQVRYEIGAALKLHLYLLLSLLCLLVERLNPVVATAGERERNKQGGVRSGVSSGRASVVDESA